MNSVLSEHFLYFGNKIQAMKDSIVRKHNELRSKVANGQEGRGVDGTQPKAANMMEIVWSDELAMVAQRYHLRILKILEGTKVSTTLFFMKISFFYLK